MQSYADYSLFTYINEGVSLQVLIYVDDLIIRCSDLKVLEKSKSYLSTCFHMKDLGNVKYFLGIEVARAFSGIFLSQQKYTRYHL